MTTFRYKGQTAGGAKVSGVLRAYDEFEAADKLRESVAIITKLEAVPEKKESVLSRPVAFRVKEKELALLCSQFAIILASGLSVERCVSMVAAQTKNKYLRRMLDKVSEEVGAGYSLAQSFENNAPYLPKTFTETLRAGEQSGTLESCFQRLHAYYDRSAKTRAKIVSTLTYPVMVIIVAIVVFVIIIAVAVPAFTDAFTDLGSGSLPGVTRALMAVSAFFTKWWWLVLGVLALLVIAYLTFRRTERGRAALAAWSLMRAPLRRIHSMNAAAQFAHSMATLLAAGLPLPRALEVTANVPAGGIDWGTQQCCIIGWGSPFDADDHTYKVFGTDKGANYSGYSNALVDEYLTLARQSSDDAVRKEYYSKFLHALADDPAYAFICYIDANYVAKSTIHGIDADTVLGHHGVGIFWNIQDWTIGE